jgi:hypothetical protein
MVRANRLGTSSVVGRRECFERCRGFDESLPLAQDWDMWLRISADWEIGIVRELLTLLRFHSGQRSADRLAMRRWEAVVIRRALSTGDLRGRRVQAAARRRLAWAHLRLGSHLARKGEAELALAEIRESLTIAPLNPLVWASLVRWTLSRRAPLNVNP